ncbi:DUF1345 domain-containing protein [Actinoplanes teichomyceticus]|uniref:Putative membrane protein n=1 Tax=Actinoplanes teichomyceticus TaxID=1867 RepID=A0A561VMK2_ACTTI|nr:DUF1345 domain-containing protein [Actinoplanes teichomyceticus]TWG12823.1 putative membrane protein [Actinoplanes teichomyceticus]GIF13567.1 hypothetical protein Ate01nite_35990 [Actinoplanes teichomyceticus]
MTDNRGTGAPTSTGRLLSVRRVSLSLAAGIAAAAVAVVLGAPELSALLGWIVAAALILVWVWRISWPQGPQGTERLAQAESRSRSTDSAVLIASGVSLAVVAEALIRSSGGQDTIAVATVIASVVAVILSWALVNTVFAFKYARMYHHDSGGGIDFKHQAPPRYSDFAYMAFTVGMAFGVTETEPTLSPVRRVVLGHALLAYAFGTGILAVAINLVTNLGQSS